MKRDRYGKAREDKVGRVIKRVAPAIGRANSAFDHELCSRNRVLTDGKDHKRRKHCGKNERNKRDQNRVGPLWDHIHALALLLCVLRLRGGGLTGHASHHQAQLFFIGLIRQTFAHDLAVKHDSNPIR